MKAGFKEAEENRVIDNLNNFSYMEMDLKNKINSTKVNHILHLILSIVTAGIWIVIWFLVAISASSERAGYNQELKKLYADKNTAEKANNSKKTKYQSSTQSSNNINMSDKDKAELKELHELKGMGVITQSEYEEKKRNILSKYN